MSGWEAYLKDIYYDTSNPASFSGPDKLFQYVKKHGRYDISKYKIRKWLQSQETYSIQRSYRRPNNRTRIVVAGIDDQWSMDLADMIKYSKYNDGIKYILIVVDVFSKYLWLRKLMDKTGESVSVALMDILRGPRRPRKLRSDMGQEFRSKKVQAILKKYNIRHFYSTNEVKSSIAERALKTLKSRITRFMTYKNSYRYIDKLQSFADSYNNTHHRTIDTEPINVTKQNEETVRLSTYFSKPHKEHRKLWRYKFKIGDNVRITHLRNVFTREYDQKWTGEVFTISKRFWRNGIPIYRIKDYNNEEITGTFYQSELQRISFIEDQMWKVEKILKTKGKGQNKQYFVKWLHWPNKFNSWVNASDVTNI